MMQIVKKLFSHFFHSATSQEDVHEHDAVLKQYQTITEHITAAVFILHADGGVVFASPYAEVLLGHSRSSLQDSATFRSIFAEEDFKRHERALHLAAVGESFQYRMKATHASGLEMWIECRTAPITTEDTPLPRVVTVMLDVTRAVKSEQLVEEKNKELREFAYMISHDLRSPLVTLQGMTTILKQSDALQGENKEVVAHMDTAVARLNQLIGSVIEYSKVTMLDPATETVDLKKVFDEIRLDIAPKIISGDIEVVFPSQAPLVQGEHTRVYRVLSNIILNAIKYRATNRNCQIKISLNIVGKQLDIAIADNGIGIPASMLESIFKPFQRAHKGPIEGLGIGLASAKKLVERCGGSIMVESTEGTGTTFHVRLLRVN